MSHKALRQEVQGLPRGQRRLDEKERKIKKRKRETETERQREKVIRRDGYQLYYGRIRMSYSNVVLV